MIRTLTPEQENTIYSIEQYILRIYAGYENKIEIHTSDIIFDSMVLHNIVVETLKTNINHVIGFWILQNGNILKIKE